MDYATALHGILLKFLKKYIYIGPMKYTRLLLLLLLLDLIFMIGMARTHTKL